jgi:hypothetical protein
MPSSGRFSRSSGKTVSAMSFEERYRSDDAVSHCGIMG